MNDYGEKKIAIKTMATIKTNAIYDPDIENPGRVAYNGLDGIPRDGFGLNKPRSRQPKSIPRVTISHLIGKEIMILCLAHRYLIKTNINGDETINQDKMRKSSQFGR